MLRTINATAAHAALLALLRDDGPGCPHTLATAIGLDVAEVELLLDDLVEAGLVDAVEVH